MSKNDTSLQKLKKYCSTLEDFKSAKLSPIKNGHNRDVYLLETAHGKYIARIMSLHNDGGSSITNEVLMLTFLKEKGIQYIPTVVHHNKRLNISIETFVAKKHLDFENITKENIALFAKQLATIHKINEKDFYLFCKKHNFKKQKGMSLLSNIQVFGVARFRKAQKTCPDTAVLNWIEPKLQKNIEEIKKLPQGRAHVVWGDIGDNILSHKKELFFIDFEFSSTGDGHELSYIKIHSHLKASAFKQLVKEYSWHSGIPIEQLYREIDSEEKIIRLNDVIWAAMKWGEYKNTKDEAVYRKLTFKRMRLFEKLR